MELLRVEHLKHSQKTPKYQCITETRDRALALAEEYEVEDVSCEIYIPASGKGMGAHPTQWTHGSVNIELVERGFPSPLYIAPPTLKKWMTSLGTAEKAEVMLALSYDYGVTITNDNEADAASLALMIADYHRWRSGSTDRLFTKIPSRPFSKYELEKMQGWKRIL